MDKTTLISEMQKFIFGSRIICSNGEDGVLTHVYFDPVTKRLTHIGIKSGRFFGKTYYVPFDTVTGASGEGVLLRITRDELDNASRSEPVGAILESRSVVQHAESAARGTLMLVVVEPDSGELDYIVARALPYGQNTLLPEQFVKQVSKGHIEVSLPDATLQTLPPYRPDAELQREVEDVLYDLTPLHVDFKGMSMRVLDSVLYLDGNISSSLRSDIVRDQALGVIGLLEIKNHLIGDDMLAGELALTLSRDPRTRDLPIGVYPRLGVVRLSGAVHTAEQKTAIKAIVGSFPGVRGMVDDMQVNPQAAMLYVLSPAEGGEPIDKIPGKYVRHTK